MINNFHNAGTVRNGAKGTGIDAGTTPDAFFLVNAHRPVLLAGLNGVHRTGAAAGTHNVHNGIVWACIKALSTLPALIGINIRLRSCHGNGIKFACLHTFFPHTLLTVVCYGKAGDGAVFTRRRQDHHRIVAVIPGCRINILRQHNAFPDNLPLLVYAAPITRFASRQDLIGQCRLYLLQISFKSCLCHMI